MPRHTFITRINRGCTFAFKQEILGIFESHLNLKKKKKICFLKSQNPDQDYRNCIYFYAYIHLQGKEKHVKTVLRTKANTAFECSDHVLHTHGHHHRAHAQSVFACSDQCDRNSAERPYVRHCIRPKFSHIQSWESPLTSLGFNFLICKMEIKLDNVAWRIVSAQQLFYINYSF